MADNWYIVLELSFDPPVEDEQVIAARIVEKSRDWSTKFNDFKRGTQYRSWHQNIPQIKADMIGPSNRRAALAEEACREVYAPINKLIQTIARKGHITRDEADKIATRQKVSGELVIGLARKLGVPVQEGAKVDHQAVYDRHVKPRHAKAHVYASMDKELLVFHVKDLYDFLYANTPVKNPAMLPCNTLRQRSGEKKANEYYKTDNISGTGTKLCAQCDDIFGDDASKAAYDEFLKFRRLDAVFGEVRDVGKITDEGISAEQHEYFAGQLTEQFRDRKLALQALTALCVIEKIPFRTKGDGQRESDTLKVCRCGHMNDVSDGRRVCKNCGLELVIKCPKCARENDNTTNVCACGFRIQDIDRVSALCDLAEFSMQRLLLSEAQAGLDEARKIWPAYVRIKALNERLAGIKASCGDKLQQKAEAAAARRFYKAKELYQSLQSQHPDYSDVAFETMADTAIGLAREYLHRAERAASEREVIEACTKSRAACLDLPGVDALIAKYPPAPPEAVTATADGNRRTNTVSWKASPSEGEVLYRIVRKKDAVPLRHDDGEAIGSISMCRYTDERMQPGQCNYYAVFAERAGVYSMPAVTREPVVNLFEARGVSATAGDASLQINWEPPAKGATVEVFRTAQAGREEHVGSRTAQGFVDTGLVNDRPYQYRVAVTYAVNGQERTTPGVRVAGTPTRPPEAVAWLRIRPMPGDAFEVVWTRPSDGEVRLYCAEKKPQYAEGEVLSLETLRGTMREAMASPLSQAQRKELMPDQDGAMLQHKGAGVLYVAAVAVKAGTAVFGAVSRASRDESVRIKSIRAVNGKIGIYLDAPKDATGFVVLYRHDRFPLDISDVKTTRKYIPIKQYQLNDALLLDTLEPKDYYVTVFAEFARDGEKDYSAGVDTLFQNGAKVSITYAVTVVKKLLGERYILVEFTSDNRTFALPDIDIVSAVGNTPMFKASAQHMQAVASQEVTGALQVKIPLPKNLPRDTHIKAFLRDDTLYAAYQLQLKVGSNHKIS